MVFPGLNTAWLRYSRWRATARLPRLPCQPPLILRENSKTRRASRRVIGKAEDAGEINVCKNGGSVGFDEDKAKEILLKDSIVMDVNMNMGNACAAAYGCDLTYEYVRINGDYRS